MRDLFILSCAMSYLVDYKCILEPERYDEPCHDERRLQELQILGKEHGGTHEMATYRTSNALVEVSVHAHV